MLSVMKVEVVLYKLLIYQTYQAQQM